MTTYPISETFPESPDVEHLLTECDPPLDPPESPDVEHLLTEDDTPVDNLPSEKNQRLLVDALYSTWQMLEPDRRFLAAANVGLYYALRQNPLVPDVFLSLDVQVAEDWWEKKNRVYFTWEFGKPPEVVIEIVSNRVGKEDSRKLKDYGKANVLYYAIFDPLNQLKQGILRLYKLQGWEYVPVTEMWMPEVGLGLTVWDGSFEGVEMMWLRWCDRAGNPIATGAERAETEREKRQGLVEKLRSLPPDQLIQLGINPTDLE